jgi:hypothetical protein
MDQDELRRLARIGAESRLAELDRERAALLRVFPGLRSGRGRKRAQEDGVPARGRRRQRRRMSASERRAVSLRMKKYWAARRKAKGT